MKDRGLNPSFDELLQAMRDSFAGAPVGRGHNDYTAGHFVNFNALRLSETLVIEKLENICRRRKETPTQLRGAALIEQIRRECPVSTDVED
jgi:hypothetical protein